MSMPEAGRDRAHRFDVVAADHLQRQPFIAESRQRILDVLANLVAHDDQRQGLHIVGGHAGPHIRFARHLGESQHAHAISRERLRPLIFGAVARQQALRRAP